jgi:hypothetical protein
MTLIEFRYIAAQIWYKSFPRQRATEALRQAVPGCLQSCVEPILAPH